jgi:hypothetical protein
MPLDPQTSANVLIQYPLAGVIVVLVGVFLWYQREMTKLEREARSHEAAAERHARAEESKEDRQARADEQRAMRDFISIQNELFLQSVKDIRDQHNQSMARLAEELKHNSTKVSELAGILTAHDAASKERGLVRR